MNACHYRQAHQCPRVSVGELRWDESFGLLVKNEKLSLPKSGNNKNKLLSKGSVPLHKFAFSLLPAGCLCLQQQYSSEQKQFRAFGACRGTIRTGKREAEYKKFSYYSWITSFVATTVCLLLMPRRIKTHKKKQEKIIASSAYCSINNNRPSRQRRKTEKINGETGTRL